MLDRLAQLVVDKLEPKIERIVQTHLDELRLELQDSLDESFSGAVNTFNIHIVKSLPEIEKRLKQEITQQIVRGIKL